MSAIAVIPARYASTRFPGKPLARETGKFLIQHVVEQVELARSIDRVIVATDDRRILEAVASFGGHAVMTREDHVSGTDRIAEVAEKYDADIFVNVQGDEPEIEPSHIDQLVSVMTADADLPIGTLACPFPADADPRDPNAVKVVVDRRGRALYFSRSLIPYPRDEHGVPGDARSWLLHIGIYAYRREFLRRLASLPTGALERIEKLEQLRVLEAGHSIAVGIVERAAVGIDTPEDYAAFIARVKARS